MNDSHFEPIHYEVYSAKGSFVGSISLTKENSPTGTRDFRHAFQKITGYEAIKVYRKREATHLVYWDKDPGEYYIKQGIQLADKPTDFSTSIDGMYDV